VNHTVAPCWPSARQRVSRLTFVCCQMTFALIECRPGEWRVRRPAGPQLRWMIAAIAVISYCGIIRLITGNVAARNGSTVIEAPSSNWRM